MKFLWQSLLLLASFTLVFVWQNTSFANYLAPMIGVMAVIYFALALKSTKKMHTAHDGPLSAFTLNTIVFIVIFSSGGITSGLFPLLYFLIFIVAFIFEASLVFIFLAGAAMVLLPQAFEANIMENLLKIGFLALISPLAYFFGKQYRSAEKQNEKVEAMQERATAAADTVSKDVEEILVGEKENLKDKDIEKLNEILEETEDLRQEAQKK